MKLIFIGVLLIGIFAFLVGPTLLHQKECYDASQTQIAEINSNVVMRGIGLRQVCEARFPILSQLQSCLHSQDTTNKIAVYKDTIASFLIPYIRPLTNTVDMQLSQHDKDCSEFKNYTFSSTL